MQFAHRLVSFPYRFFKHNIDFGITKMVIDDLFSLKTHGVKCNKSE